MKAAVRSKYGSPEVLSIKEIETPTPKDNKVLLQVYAAIFTGSSLNYANEFQQKNLSSTFLPPSWQDYF